MANFKKTTVAGPRTELHDALGLTGCEASYNVLPAGAAVPFVHAHKHNEELYVVTRDWAATFYELSPPIRTPKLAYANFDEQLGG